MNKKRVFSQLRTTSFYVIAEYCQIYLKLNAATVLPETIYYSHFIGI